MILYKSADEVIEEIPNNVIMMTMDDGVEILFLENDYDLSQEMVKEVKCISTLSQQVACANAEENKSINNKENIKS